MADIKSNGLPLFALEILKGKVDRKIKRLRKPPKWLFPSGDERLYKKEMKIFIDGMEQAARDTILKALPSIVENANILRPDLATNIDSVHNDAYVDDVEKQMRKFLDKVKSFFKRATTAASVVMNRVNVFNTKQFGKITNSIFGIPLFQNEPWLKQELNSVLAENTQLITNIQEDVRNDIQNVVNRGIREGKRHETIAREILNGTKLKKGIFAKARNRARLVARDQVEKWNGQLTQLKQTNAGVTEYEWDTAMDERVRGRPGGKFPKARPTHWAMQGKICLWSDPTVYKDNIDDKIWKKRSSIGGPLAHPGQPINCRCIGSPRFESVEALKDL